MMKSRGMIWAGHVARTGEKSNPYRVLVGMPGGKSPLGKPRRKREDDIKMYLREIRWDFMRWIHLAQDRDQWLAFVKTVIKLCIL
jgi:hypothetical protein